jgi:hypothetical protein
MYNLYEKIHLALHLLDYVLIYFLFHKFFMTWWFFMLGNFISSWSTTTFTCDSFTFVSVYFILVCFNIFFCFFFKDIFIKFSRINTIFFCMFFISFSVLFHLFFMFISILLTSIASQWLYGNPSLLNKGTKSFWHLEHLDILLYNIKRFFFKSFYYFPMGDRRDGSAVCEVWADRWAEEEVKPKVLQRQSLQRGEYRVWVRAENEGEGKGGV